MAKKRSSLEDLANIDPKERPDLIPKVLSGLSQTMKNFSKDTLTGVSLGHLSATLHQLQIIFKTSIPFLKEAIRRLKGEQPKC